MQWTRSFPSLIYASTKERSSLPLLSNALEPTFFLLLHIAARGTFALRSTLPSTAITLAILLQTLTLLAVAPARGLIDLLEPFLVQFIMDALHFNVIASLA